MIPLLALAAAGSALQGFATIGAGYQSAKAAKAAELGATIERDMARLRRTQIGEESRANLATMLGTVQALRSTRGAGLDSPTGQLIERRTRQDGYRAEAIAGLAELNRQSSADMAAKGHRSAARWAVPMSVLNAAGSFAQAASYGKQAFTRPDPIADLKGLY